MARRGSAEWRKAISVGTTKAMALLPRQRKSSVGYRQAHQRAEARLGPPPEVCPSCGERPEATNGRRRMHVSYLGGRGYDPSGVDYIWECIYCNHARRVGSKQSA